MARPRIIKFPEGEVIFKNLPKEKQDQLFDLVMANKEAQPQSIPIQPVVEQQTQTQVTLNSDLPLQKSFGLFKDSSGNWNLVEVRYDLDSREAEVAEVKNFGKDKNIAVGEFKFKVAKEFL